MCCYFVDRVLKMRYHTDIDRHHTRDHDDVLLMVFAAVYAVHIINCLRQMIT